MISTNATVVTMYVPDILKALKMAASLNPRRSGKGHRYFKSQACYDKHKLKPSNSKKSARPKPNRETCASGIDVTVTMEEAYHNTMFRADYLRQKGIQVHEIWECEYERQLKSNPKMKAFVDAIEIREPLQPRDAIFGGRTNAVKLHHVVEEYEQKEGIQLDQHAIEKNDGKRALAKLMLNSFWGKFGQRSKLHQTTFINNLSNYMELLLDATKTLKNIRFSSDDVAQLQWEHDDDYISVSHVFIGAYTTAQARLKLYSYLERFDKRVLYFDIGSIIYVSTPEAWDPPIGNSLGDMTDELRKPYGEGSYITEFVSGGPQNYAYKVFRPDNQSSTRVCKVRGITLNFASEQQINFESMRQLLPTLTRASKVEKANLTLPHENTTLESWNGRFQVMQKGLPIGVHEAGAA
ncbi:hypothetical protein HOLleu_37008 [Holothuria leucospilota]|uniref:DNA-directed DNA polymerase n=1 Tax=Holothuria leucospilota TaxID=206669 RepID=A0A9Q1BG19_HOLLE|nr:hypothetical protein HOLleu_37008 [Holothuria leucospilota]